ncbi:MAG: DNA polymerase III subunit beta [Actinobacteria bacterium]|nr:DNA polymerase III subunit beta [Actinomycetota bacterium]
MKFTVDSSVLTDSVQWVSRSLSTRPIMTALLGIVIDVDTEVTLSASDLETSAKSSFKPEIENKGRVLVPGRLLAEIARSLPNKPTTFTLDGNRVQVTSGSAKFALPTLPLNEYPNLPKLHIKVNKNSITMAATDRYRLAVREIPWIPTDPELTTSALLRARTLADAARSIATTKELSFAIAPTTATERLIGFATESKSITSRQLDGTFPPYEHLIPTDSASVAVIEVASLLEAVRRVALVTEKNTPLRFRCGATLQLEAGVKEEAQANEELSINFKGEPIEIAFNPNYLIDGLSARGRGTSQSGER